MHRLTLFFSRLWISLSLIVVVCLSPAGGPAPVQAADGARPVEEAALSGPRQAETLSAGAGIPSEGKLIHRFLVRESTQGDAAAGVQGSESK